MNYILLTNVKKNGQPLDEENTDFLICTNLDADTIADAYRQEGSITFDDHYPIKGEDLSTYIYEPVELSKDEEQAAINRAKQYREAQPA